MEKQEQESKKFDGCMTIWKENAELQQSTLSSINGSYIFDVSTQCNLSPGLHSKPRSSMGFEKRNIQIQIWKQSFSSPQESGDGLPKSNLQHKVTLETSTTEPKQIQKTQSILHYPYLPTLSQVNGSHQHDQDSNSQDSDGSGLQQASNEISRHIIQGYKKLGKRYEDVKICQSIPQRPQRVFIAEQVPLKQVQPRQTEQQENSSYFEYSISESNTTEQQIIDLMTQSEMANKKLQQKIPQQTMAAFFGKSLIQYCSQNQLHQIKIICKENLTNKFQKRRQLLDFGIKIIQASQKLDKYHSSFLQANQQMPQELLDLQNLRKDSVKQSKNQTFLSEKFNVYEKVGNFIKLKIKQQGEQFKQICNRYYSDKSFPVSKTKISLQFCSQIVDKVLKAKQQIERIQQCNLKDEIGKQEFQYKQTDKNLSQFQQSKLLDWKNAERIQNTDRRTVGQEEIKMKRRIIKDEQSEESEQQIGCQQRQNEMRNRKVNSKKQERNQQSQEDQKCQNNSKQYQQSQGQQYQRQLPKAKQEKLQDLLNKSSYSACQQVNQIEQEYLISKQDLYFCFGKWLMKTFTVNSLAQLSQTCSKYNSSNYFHVGPRYSMLSSLQSILLHFNKLLKYEGLTIEEVTEEIREDILQAQQGQHIQDLGQKIGLQVQAKSGSFFSTISGYYSSNYFHVGPRYQMIDFMRQLISEIAKCRQILRERVNQMNEYEIGNVSEIMNSSISTQVSLKK